jgi:hypothetical protein
VEHRKKIAEAVNDPDLTISYDLRGGVVTCNVADSIRCIAEIRSDDDRHVPPGVLGAAERLIDAGLFPGMRPRQLVEDVVMGSRRVAVAVRREAGEARNQSA